MTCLRWLLFPCLWLAVAFPDAALAQAGFQRRIIPVKEYKPFPVEGNLVLLLKAQLLQAQDAETLKTFLENELKNNPDLQRLMKEKDLSKLRAGEIDEQTRKNLEQFLKNNKSLDADKLKAMQRALEQQRDEAKGQPDGNGPGKDGFDPNGPEAALPKMPAADGKTTLEQWVMKVLTKSSNSKLRERLDASPAFGKTKAQLAKWVGKGQDDHTGGAADAAAKAFGKTNKSEPGGGPLPLPDPDWLKLPGGDGGAASSSPVGLSGIGGLAGAGSLPGGTALSGGLAFVQFLLVLLMVGVVAAVVWKLLSRAAARTPQVGLAVLGPWPVAPDQASSREQPIQAFEYLALLLLGEPARTTNHRDIAGSLGATPEQDRAAAELALFYEKARYDPASGELPPSALAAARRDLCLLAARTPAAPVSR